jgi:glycerophosphoryl diester phosphodiesterase
VTDAPRPQVIAHRGASAYRPEHTLAAYRLAIALGADAIEPDIVPTKDGQLILRHENEIGGTTDIAERPEFADRRRTQTIDGERVTGWFTEDFTWAELATLRARERLPELRQASARFDGRYPILRLRDLVSLLDGANRPVRMVAELKHATHFASIGLPLDELFAAELAGWGGREQLAVESFEQTVLGQVRARGVDAEYVYLLERRGAPADLVALHGATAPSYASQLTDAGLLELARDVDGISPEVALIVKAAAGSAGRGDANWRMLGHGLAASSLVARAHDRGLRVYTWTLRAENRFLPAPCRVGTAKAAHGDWLHFFRAVMATGLDGVFADQPDLALEARAAP